MEFEYVNGVKCFVWYDAKGNKHLNATGVVSPDDLSNEDASE